MSRPTHNMTEPTLQPTLGPAPSLIACILVTLLVLPATFLVGHYATRLLTHSRPAPAAAGVITGDAVGRGPADVPVPPGAQRVFAMASPQGAGKYMFRYRSPAREADLLRFYRQALPAHGWSEQPLPRQAPAAYPGTLLWYSNAKGNLCMISLSPNEDGGTWITMMRLPGAGR